MISYSKRYVNIVSLLITILIYIFLSKSNFLFNQIDFNLNSIPNILEKNLFELEVNSSSINQGTKEEEIEDQNNQSATKTEEKALSWKITIPKISLDAEISEGTSQEIMDQFVGHFEETSKTIGNIGLAAHNRGYKVNYFSEIKKLKEGDEIIYKYYDFEKTYIVVKNKIIKDTDWSNLENTNENKITLITCVENEPEYRRCIQGVEKQ